MRQLREEDIYVGLKVSNLRDGTLSLFLSISMLKEQTLYYDFRNLSKKKWNKYHLLFFNGAVISSISNFMLQNGSFLSTVGISFEFNWLSNDYIILLHIESINFLIFFLLTSFSSSKSKTIVLNSVITYQHNDFTVINTQLELWFSLIVLESFALQKLLVLDFIMRSYLKLEIW